MLSVFRGSGVWHRDGVCWRSSQGTQSADTYGVDISEPSLVGAAPQQRSPSAYPFFRLSLWCQDFPGALQTWSGPLDVVWIGQSPTTLRAPEKESDSFAPGRSASFYRRMACILIWEPTLS